jgi:hypothetical protein
MDNIVRGGTVTASSAVAGFPASAAANPLTYEFWRPETVPATWAVDAGAAVTCNYIGIAAHTLQGAEVEIEYSLDNSTWEKIGSNGPTNNAPIMFLFAPITARYWRIVVKNQVSSIGVVYIGQTLDMQRPCFAGLSPINFTRETVIRPNRSESGQWVGRSIVRQGSSMSVSFRHLEYDWYKNNFDPFVEEAREYPFFFAWRPDDYPETVGYVWTAQDITPSTMGIRNLLEVGFEMQGLAIE